MGFFIPFYNNCRSGVFSKAGAFNPCLEETMPCNDLGVTAKSKKRKCCNRSVTADDKNTFAVTIGAATVTVARTAFSSY